MTVPAKKIYAASKAGVTPSAYITWFQAQQACRNVGKKLIASDDWQAAAAGTPDPGTDDGTDDCNISATGAISLTGSRANCVSNWGSHDMVGNGWEWVADWMQANSDIDDGPTSTVTYGTDGLTGIDEASPATDRFPAALLRGGDFNDGTVAGVFTVNAGNAPSVAFIGVGFRCAR
jgi:formylglycine-generating enzyme required for sulfatase activity